MGMQDFGIDNAIHFGGATGGNMVPKGEMDSYSPRTAFAIKK